MTLESGLSYPLVNKSTDKNRCIAAGHPGRYDRDAEVIRMAVSSSHTCALFGNLEVISAEVSHVL